eukprot:1327932-Rhodomonas_salina.1
MLYGTERDKAVGVGPGYAPGQVGHVSPAQNAPSGRCRTWSAPPSAPHTHKHTQRQTQTDTQTQRHTPKSEARTCSQDEIGEDWGPTSRSRS